MVSSLCSRFVKILSLVVLYHCPKKMLLSSPTLLLRAGYFAFVHLIKIVSNISLCNSWVMVESVLISNAANSGLCPPLSPHCFGGCHIVWAEKILFLEYWNYMLLNLTGQFYFRIVSCHVSLLWNNSCFLIYLALK